MSKVFDALKHKEQQAPEVNLRGIGAKWPSKRDHRLDVEDVMAGLYQNIESALPNAGAKIIQFVGSREGEGTSTIVREFARVSSARLRKSVLVLDADRLRPVQQSFFNVSSVPYVEDALKKGDLGTNTFRQCLDSKVFLGMVCRENASFRSVVESIVARGVLETLRQRFDLILIDSPPITASPESLLLSGKVDGVILVVEAENTRWPIADAVKSQIIKNGGNILGLVLNKRKHYIPSWIYEKL